MDSEGTFDARGTRSNPVPRPAGPPKVPPRPTQDPKAAAPLVDWLNAPRRAQAPGMWKYGHVPPRPQTKSDRATGRALLIGAVISLLSGLLLWSLLRNGYIPYARIPLRLVTPAEWWNPTLLGGPRVPEARIVTDAYWAVVGAALIYVFGRIGNWPEVLNRFVGSRPQPLRAVISAVVAALVQWFVWPLLLPVVISNTALLFAAWLPNRFVASLAAYGLYALIAVALLRPFARLGDWAAVVRELRDGRTAGSKSPAVPPSRPAISPADWPDLRDAGQHEAADRLTAELREGRMNDVDCVRVRHAWESMRTRPGQRASFTDTILRQGAAAWTHPSGDRDLPQRIATHDLLAAQVRIGTCADHERNPHPRRGSGVALEPALLGTSLLAVGPSGAGKTRRLVRPVVEALALQALAGQGGVVAVCAAGTPLGPDEAFDVVVRIGDPASAHDFDLYGGTTDPDEAAGFLAEGLVGDLDTVDSRRAATALAQFLGPYQAAHGRFPAVPELYELLHGAPAALTALRDVLEADGHRAMQRELAARVRQMGTASDPCPALADRLALLDRPVFEDFFDAGETARPFVLRALQRHPLRVRVDLPERTHAEASRLIARLILAQFTALSTSGPERSLFTCLVLDDATGTLTTGTVRGIRLLRSANAAVVLGLRAIDDVPEGLHVALLGAVGCHMAFSGVTTWDGKRFTEAWGTEWVETKEVAQHTVFADQPLTRALHALRKLVTGKAVTTDAVTVRKVERARWSASELAYSLPAGHAVLSLTTVRGEHVPPLLVDLRT